jgi:hypothetical protein
MSTCALCKKTVCEAHKRSCVRLRKEAYSWWSWRPNVAHKECILTLKYERIRDK